MGIFEQLQDPKYNMFAQGQTKKTVKDKNDVMTGTMAFENGIKMLIGKEFGGQANGFDVKFEGRKFRPSQFGNKILENIQDQLSGKEAKVCEISFHDRYLCDVDESMRPEQVIVIIQMAIQRRIEKGDRL